MKKLLMLISLTLGTSMAAYGADKVNEMVLIAGGDFKMGCSKDDTACDKDEGPKGGVTVKVPTFKIQRFEVSNGEYRQCVEAGECQRPFDNKRNKYCGYDAPGRDDFPVNCINWYKAKNYCSWINARLPFEPEWEFAARGNTTSKYPWGGDSVTCDNALMDDGILKDANGEADGCGKDLLAPRGSKPANPFGLYDMHGSIAEWVENWYSQDSHSTLYTKGNLSGPVDGQYKVLRGGAWDEQERALTSSSRWAKGRSGHRSIYGSNGLRCAQPIQ
ncbi:MAG: sulfatase modifying factor 1 [Alteromonadaceae bacterium]|jgi:sulfatase modifying factor 1